MYSDAHYPTLLPEGDARGVSLASTVMALYKAAMADGIMAQTHLVNLGAHCNYWESGLIEN